MRFGDSELSILGVSGSGFCGSRFWVSGAGFRGGGFGFGVSRLGVSGAGFRCSRFPVRCFEARDFGVGVSQLRVSGSWFLMFGVSN